MDKVLGRLVATGDQGRAAVREALKAFTDTDLPHLAAAMASRSRSEKEEMVSLSLELAAHALLDEHTRRALERNEGQCPS